MEVENSVSETRFEDLKAGDIFAFEKNSKNYICVKVLEGDKDYCLWLSPGYPATNHPVYYKQALSIIIHAGLQNYLP